MNNNNNNLKVSLRKFESYHSNNEMEFHLWNNRVATEHGHDFFEFAICIDGEISHKKNNEKSILHKKNAIFIVPNDFHSLTSIGGVTAVHINMSVGVHLFYEICDYLNFPINSIYSLRRQITLTDEEFDYLYKLGNLCSMHDPNSDIQTRLLKTMITNMLSIFINRGFVNYKQIPTWLLDFSNKIFTPEFFDKRIKDLYDISGYSQTSLSAYFRKYYGKSFVQYFTEEKIKYSCNLLKNTNMLIIDISNKVGFSSLSHFNKKFKEIIGTIPSKFRELK